MKKILIVSTLGVFLSGCLTTGMSPQQGAGTVIGAASGALLGSRFGKGNGRLASTAVGTAVGALAGNLITQPHEAPQQGYYPEPEYYQPQPQPRRHHQPQPRRQHRVRAPQKQVVHNHYYKSDCPIEHNWYE